MIGKVIINHDTGCHIPCCWMDCWKDGVELHKFVDTSAAPAEVITYVFCSDRHRGYFINSPRNMGNLPPGSRLSVT